MSLFDFGVWISDILLLKFSVAATLADQLLVGNPKVVKEQKTQ